MSGDVPKGGNLMIRRLGDLMAVTGRNPGRISGEALGMCGWSCLRSPGVAI